MTLELRPELISQLGELPVIDAHCHPITRAELVGRASDGFLTRMTFLGAAQLSSRVADPSNASAVAAASVDSLLVATACRWLAPLLDCDPTVVAVTHAREVVLQANPDAYIDRLMTDQGVVGVLADDGFPPGADLADFAGLLGGRTVWRVGRLEPWIEAALREPSFAEATDQLVARMREASRDPGLVGFKSIAAYRTGLDIGAPTARVAAAAFKRLRAGRPRDQTDDKTVRDYWFHLAMSVCEQEDRVFHVHTGAGDLDVQLERSRPDFLFPALLAHQRLRTLLVHSGYPWVAEAVYLASVLPNVHIDLSEMVPWAWSHVDWALELSVGTVPLGKVLHGSDACGEPEQVWLAARLVREALGRVLGRFEANDWVGRTDQIRIAQSVLGGAAARLHGIREPG